MTDILQRIRDLQFTNKEQAESLLLAFFRDVLQLPAQSILLTPHAVSLNSFNGIVTFEDGRRQFFKSHTEADTIIGEYYRGELLAEAGYPVIQPVFRSTDPGKQLLIYELVEDSSVFDIAWEIEKGNPSKFDTLQDAQYKADDALFKLYQKTLHWQSAAEAATAPVHQLFYHRLTGGRLDRFYSPREQDGRDRHIELPDQKLPLKTILSANWTINSRRFSDSLSDLINRAIELLNPAQAGPAITGHGDAHNGNVFLRSGSPPSVLYFDPAFAGRHHPLLDLTKPLFHNVFAMWMYYPQDLQERIDIEWEFKDNEIIITYQEQIPEIRQMFFNSKFERVLIPTLRILKENNWLRADWREYLKAALFCCPLLTMNLGDAARFPPEISLLGLAMSVEMGAKSLSQDTMVDQALTHAGTALS